MRRRPLTEVAAAAGGTFRAPGAESSPVEAVVVDSRLAGPGGLFVALAGERSDGHGYVPAALDQGAAGALVRAGTDVPDRFASRLIDVVDPGHALLSLAREERSALSARVIGVTGSTGKTCTKDFLGAVLARRFRVVRSPASYNNEVGLPLTILGAPADAEVVVCEMGARGAGHIRLLCDVARPHIGVVTNVGVAHMELFGSPEALRDAKAELPEALPPDGTAVLNADDPMVASYAQRTPAGVVTFGLSEGADVRGEHIVVDHRTGRARFDLIAVGTRTEVTLPVPGEQMVPNALAAAAVGAMFGMSGEDCAAGLREAEISAGRMEVFEGEGGVRVINDAYNANPVSMAAALKTARWMARDARCLAVLGHMAELGPIADQEHERVGELAARLRLDELVVVGPEARLIASGAQREGVEANRIHLCQDADDALRTVRSMARPSDLILVKASRVARLDRLAEALRSDPGEDRPTAEVEVPVAKEAAR
jgi:UDP-N-acetylmuramoyl-tripeptide--D-alanyl-D-alanine ligase